MAKKKGPPYEDDPECQYVVVANPWPGNKIGAQRNNVYFNWMSAWLSFMFEPREKPEELYYVSTRVEIIARFSQDVDLTKIFGEHSWSQTLTERAGRQDPKSVSYIFPYNYRRLGHPSEHNWATHLPEPDPPPNHPSWPPPVKVPYPPATWVRLPPSSWASLALAVAEPPLPNEGKEKPAETQADVADRPAHYALAHQLTEPPPPPRPPRPPRPSPPPQVKPDPESKPLQAPMFVKKLDPYEEEEDAFRFLKAEPEETKLPSLHVKEDPDADIKPNIKQETEPSGGFNASDELRAAFAEYERSRNASVVTEPSEPRAGLRVKPEPADGEMGHQFHGERGPSVKAEPTDAILSRRPIKEELHAYYEHEPETSTVSPRTMTPSPQHDQRDSFLQRTQFPARLAKRVKAEDLWDESDDVSSKKRRY